MPARIWTRRPGRRGRALGLITALFTLAAVVSAAADPVPGATYTGTAADGALMTFTVSRDGTLVNSYRITDAPRQGCQFYGVGLSNQWEGAPVQNNSFQYQLGNAIILRGTFTGPQTATGTFRFQDPPNANGPACDSGTVTWTAKTDAAPPPGGGSSSAGGGGVGGGGGSGSGGGSAGGGAGAVKGTAGRRVYGSRVALRVLSRERLGGRIGSSLAGCRSGRTVMLWRGSRRVALGTSKRGGAYAFGRSGLWRGRIVRVSVTARHMRHGGVCAAASSTFIHA